MRRTDSITVPYEGRDRGKTLTIEEMPAEPAFEWFVRAGMLLARAGAEVPPDLFENPPLAFATIGIGTVLSGLSKASFTEVRPLLAELMACVRALDSPSGIPVTNLDQIRGQIEEMSTLPFIYERVLSLHLGFSIADRFLSLREVLLSALSVSPDTSTSSNTSEQSPRLN